MEKEKTDLTQQRGGRTLTVRREGERERGEEEGKRQGKDAGGLLGKGRTTAGGTLRGEARCLRSPSALFAFVRSGWEELMWRKSGTLFFLVEIGF
jgi:hypothetical protein